MPGIKYPLDEMQRRYIPCTATVIVDFNSVGSIYQNITHEPTYNLNTKFCIIGLLLKPIWTKYYFQYKGEKNYLHTLGLSISSVIKEPAHNKTILFSCSLILYNIHTSLIYSKQRCFYKTKVTDVYQNKLKDVYKCLLFSHCEILSYTNFYTIKLNRKAKE